MPIGKDITEKELVNKCLRGEPLAQKSLYDQYSPVMYSICMRYAKNAENARDLLQESFIKVFEGLKYFRFQGSFEGWLKRVAVNTCLDFNKKLKSEPYNEELDLHAQIGQQETMNTGLQAKDLIHLLQKLPVGYRTVFNLYAIEGYSHSEIADSLGISDNTSKTQLFKARKLLQAMLAELEK